MDDYQEQASELAKAAVKEVLAPVQELFQKLLGPAASEVGLSLADSARVWRLKRAIRLFEEVKTMVDTAGLAVKPVAPRLLFPILDAASLEDDDELRKRWASLLANAATADFSSEISPAFADVLRQLTPKEARFLDGFTSKMLGNLDFMTTNLLRLGLVTVKDSSFPYEIPFRDAKTMLGVKPQQYLHMTPFGRAFVRACSPPVPSKM